MRAYYPLPAPGCPDALSIAALYVQRILPGCLIYPYDARQDNGERPPARSS